MNVITQYLQEALEELHKVRWPTRKQAIRLSWIVILFTLVSSLVLGSIDIVLNNLVSFLISLR
jgi:preprotein translocase SecE subunit